MDHEIDVMLVKMSDRQRISVNQLVNNALRYYTEWGAFADTIGLLELNKHTVQKLFDSISIEQARKLGVDAGDNTWQEMVSFMFKTVNYDSIVKMLELRGKYGHWFIFDRTEQSHDTDVLLVKHDLGSKVTAFFAEAIKRLLDHVNVQYDIEEAMDQLILNIHLDKNRRSILATSNTPIKSTNASLFDKL
jgi:hypothetical protein